jgi:hypothetical protein
METHRSEKPKSGFQTRPSEKNEKEGAVFKIFRMASERKKEVKRREGEERVRCRGHCSWRKGKA